MSSEGDGGGAAEDRWSDPVCDAPIAGVPFFGKSRVAAAPEAFSFLVFSCSLICVCHPRRG